MNTFVQLTNVNGTAGNQTASDFGVVGAEGDAVGQLVRMLNQLKTETETSLQELREEETGRIRTFAQVKTTLDNVINKLVDEGTEIRAD